MKEEREFKGLAKLPEKEILDRLKPFGSEPRYDRNCMECGKAIYQGVLCAECHSKASNDQAAYAN